ncbi:hypothetical protein ACLMJK_006675 [Lecanora helva]
MFSEVAHHHQQHLVPQSSYFLPHDGFKGIPPNAAPYNTQPSLVQHASFRERTEKSKQHAHPLRNTAALPQQLSTQTARVPKSDVSEHMLRRKTPNGTLAAGYDGSPVEWTRRPHAVKHLLTSNSDRPGRVLFTHQAPDSFSEQPQLPDEQSLESKVGKHLRLQAYHDDAPGEILYDSAVIDDNKHSRKSGFNTAQSAGIDSMLNQSSFYQQNYEFAEGHHIPTVLQPMWPPCLGSTSIHSPGPCGPYWPDGAFEPYHPTVSQDNRFRDQIAQGKRECSAQAWPAVNSFGQRQHPSRDTHYHPSSDQSFLSGQTSARARHGSISSNLNVDSSGPRATVGSSNASLSAPQNVNGGMVYGKGQPLSLDESSRISTTLSGSLKTQNTGIPLSPFFPVQESVPSDNNIQFKEKILIWAHRIYGSLLASIEQTRKHQISEQSNATAHHQSSFYQLPPRRPYPSWSSDLHRGKRFYSLSKGSVNTPGSAHANHSGGIGRYDDHDSTIDNTIFPPSSRASSTLSPRSQNGQRGNLPDGFLKAHPLVAPSNCAPFQIVSDLQQSSPSAAAIYAIEILGRLCQESGFQWIDGMLLSGCLAYGIGDFENAMKWYLEVLQRNPDHVEAISNLAATLLALNRKDEAEHYWLHSIKLRPSYFEATEHLIGLLHEGHRGQEAVNLIKCIEHALRVDHGTSTFDHKKEAPHDLYTNLATQHFGSSGYAISPVDNGRMLALVHGKGNMLYQLGDNTGAAQAFEDAILIGSGKRHLGIRGLITRIMSVFAEQCHVGIQGPHDIGSIDEPILLTPDMALATSRLVFPPHGLLPGLTHVPVGFSQKAAVSIVSNSLLSLAKIYQDAMSSSGATVTTPRATSGVQEILALYYLSLSLQPSPSTANNVGILLASVQQSARSISSAKLRQAHPTSIPGVTPGSGVALALAYYDYGLKLDTRHAHLYTNLGSLFKDIGQLQAAIKMYEKAVECDGNFDIALANLANAVKDQGRVSDAIEYYKRAVDSNPDFAEAVCGLANALNSVCSWSGRGGVHCPGGNRDRWHVDQQGDLYDSRKSTLSVPGWIARVVAIVEKQLNDGEGWGKGILRSVGIERMLKPLNLAISFHHAASDGYQISLSSVVEEWAGHRWEGAKVVRFIERTTKTLVRQIYLFQHVKQRPVPQDFRVRPQLPPVLAVPSAPTVLPFHTFTCPLSAKQIRKISQRNALRVSCSTLRAPWLSSLLSDPPSPPNPHLNVGYVSSDFNNHPLAHLMQSVFGFHDRNRVRAICYATTASDGSVHRQQIEREAPVFYDASPWSVDRLVNQVVADGIHILINLNGYTRGARNEVFAARPAPIQMSFMGFAGTLGAEWCDYLLADEIAIPPQTLRPWRGNVDLIDQTKDGNNDDDHEDWVYGENIIFTKDTFFCCDHRQSAPDSREARISWAEEQRRRWEMRKALFPNLADDAVILGNFNQLYKIEPTTFRTWLRILARIPKAVLWLLRFPDLGEENLRRTALRWVGTEVASRIIFTDVAPKHQHISRACICDLFLDTPECNAHTTAADVLWAGTPLLTLPRYQYKMCSRMAASILRGALPKTDEGDEAAKDLIAESDEAYEEQAVELGSDLSYSTVDGRQGVGQGKLVKLRKLLFESRWSSALFDTRRWVRDLESAYWEAWRKWVAGEGGDIWL